MFCPTPQLHPHGRPVGPEGNPISGPVQPPVLLTEGYLNNYGVPDSGRIPIPLDLENQLVNHHGIPNSGPPQDPLFLSELEYRNNGLRQRKPLVPAIAGGEVGHPVEPRMLDQELKQLLRNPSSSGIDSAIQQREALPTNPNFLTEKEYRMYGLRTPQQIPNPAPPRNIQGSGDVCDPYDESTTSLVNRYLTMSRTTTAPADPYPLPCREPYTNELKQENDCRIHQGSSIPDGERAFAASYTLGEQYDFNEIPYLLNSHKPSTSAPVSQRYSFAGPLTQQR